MVFMIVYNFYIGMFAIFRDNLSDKICTIVYECHVLRLNVYTCYMTKYCVLYINSVFTCFYHIVL